MITLFWDFEYILKLKYNEKYYQNFNLILKDLSMMTGNKYPNNSKI